MKRRAGSLLLLALTGVASAEPQRRAGARAERRPDRRRGAARPDGARRGHRPAHGAEAGGRPGRRHQGDPPPQPLHRADLPRPVLDARACSRCRPPTSIGAYMLSAVGRRAACCSSTGVLTSAGVARDRLRRHRAARVPPHRRDQRHRRQRAAARRSACSSRSRSPTYKDVPAFGIAFRLGVPRTERFAATTVIDETVTDLYLVGRLRFECAPWLTLHGGARISSAKIELFGDRAGAETPRPSTGCALPTAGYEIAMNPDGEDRRRDRARAAVPRGCRAPDDGAGDRLRRARPARPALGGRAVGDHRRQHRLPDSMSGRSRPPRGSTRSCNGTSGSVPRCSCPGARWPAAPSGCSVTSARARGTRGNDEACQCDPHLDGDSSPPRSRGPSRRPTCRSAPDPAKAAPPRPARRRAAPTPPTPADAVPAPDTAPPPQPDFGDPYAPVKPQPDARRRSRCRRSTCPRC